jgi:hypothetical protein
MIFSESRYPLFRIMLQAVYSSFKRGTPRGLFGGIGSMAAYS